MLEVGVALNCMKVAGLHGHNLKLVVVVQHAISVACFLYTTSVLQGLSDANNFDYDFILE